VSAIDTIAPDTVLITCEVIMFLSADLHNHFNDMKIELVMEDLEYDIRSIDRENEFLEYDGILYAWIISIYEENSRNSEILEE